MQTVDPLAVRLQVGLRGLALDLVVNGVLLAVGFGHPIMIERKEAAAEEQPRHQNRRPARRYELMPQALNAVISLFLASTPNTTSTDANTATGVRS